ncbi:hypothetical protein N7376_15800 [Brucella intermedia GD04153]|uniref:Phage ABA sandwich domain-containing protein n=1 Tax=Brucella intermedia GD04153 TaxID=2975438 RepID=A0AA42H2P2_9HYPH|nr:hypothetical protein [Brucella intermedia]MDH0125472.1 hypothetical protein [Brucella intermedia GD04153]
MTQNLITRLSKLDAPDRGMDAEIEVAVRRIEAARSGLAEEYWANWQASPDGTVYDPHTRYSSNPFTASVDAVIALAKRVFGKVGYSVAETEDDGEAPFAFIHVNGEAYLGEGAMPAIALLIALLRAKEASHG